MSKPGEESSKFRVLSFTESLGEDIGDLLMCVDILQFYISILYLFSEPVVFEIEVLGSFSEAGVSRDFNARLWVLVKWNALPRGNLPEFGHQPSYVYRLLRCFECGDVFGFGS